MSDTSKQVEALNKFKAAFDAAFTTAYNQLCVDIICADSAEPAEPAALAEPDGDETPAEPDGDEDAGNALAFAANNSGVGEFDAEKHAREMAAIEARLDAAEAGESGAEFDFDANQRRVEMLIQNRRRRLNLD